MSVLVNLRCKGNDRIFNRVTFRHLPLGPAYRGEANKNNILLYPADGRKHLKRKEILRST
ncbi:MAG TPA: hypothetical protein DDZ96_05885 [Porphyromonadaceae bacterium]|jgi:hypothetical protein|nr:hypothetical protein [Porphyromonadaceae bacterium]HCM21272.1 hypothetical protein [Porphyromonadaceae bacterium]